MSHALDQEIRKAVAEIPGISILVLFGSCARGDVHSRSDLDVAVLMNEEFDRTRPGFAGNPRVRIAQALADLSPHPEERVDVVLLDEAPAVLRQKIMEHGRMIICRDVPAWKALRVQTMREYGDQEWSRRVFREGMARRIDEGRFGRGRRRHPDAAFERAG